jgi:hypothetical protein
MQGYLYHRPIALTSFIAVLRQQDTVELAPPSPAIVAIQA